MQLPKIDIASLPDLPVPTGLFGSASAPGFDDSLIIIMVYIYEVLPPSTTSSALGGLF